MILMTENKSNAEGVQPVQVQGNVTVTNTAQYWDPISGRLWVDTNAGGYVHRQIRGAVTNSTSGGTTDLGSFTAGSRDEVLVDFEAFIGHSNTVPTSTAPGSGFVIIDQAGTILREFYLDATIDASGGGSGSLRRIHITAPSQREPIAKLDAGTVCNIRYVSINSTSATINVNFSVNSLAIDSTTVGPGII